MKYKHLSIAEREEILCGLREKRSIRDIAASLGRSSSSISREILRNKPPQRNSYVPHLAEERAILKCSSRGRTERLKNDIVRSYAIARLKKRWSPEQISGKIESETGFSISPEAIYQFIYAQFSDYGLKPGREDLRSFLRRRRKRRAPKGARRCQRVRPYGISIDSRPSIVTKRIRVGDWEGDTVESANHKPGINTLVDRKSGLVLITKLEGKTGRATKEAVVSRLSCLPKKARHTLTLDNGPENSSWRNIQLYAGIQCFFAHPYHSWERGTNENTNGLIRDYFPKKTDFTNIADEEIQKVEYDLNTRPRKRLGWKTPLEVFSVALRS